LGFLIPFNSWGHDPSKHKGRATNGEIISIANDRLELKTSAGTKTVVISDQTKFERDNEKVTKEDLKAGDPVVLFGTTLATGEIVAREILLTKSDAQDGNKNKSGHKH